MFPQFWLMIGLLRKSNLSRLSRQSRQSRYAFYTKHPPTLNLQSYLLCLSRAYEALLKESTCLNVNQAVVVTMRNNSYSKTKYSNMKSSKLR